MAEFYGAQFQRTLIGTVLGTNDEPDESLRIIDFDDEIIDGGTDITQVGGLFTIKTAGNYYISWFLTLKTGLGTSGPSVSLKVTPSTGTPVYYPSATSIKTAQFSGSAILRVPTNTTATIALYNTGTDEFTFATNVDVKANMTILPYVTNTSSSSYGIVGTVLTLDDPASVTLEYEAPVLFNKPTGMDNNDFAYDPATGIITLKRVNTYTFDWCINLSGSTDAASIKFAIVPTTSISTQLATFESTILMQSSYTGFALIKTENVNTTIKLINLSATSAAVGATLMYSLTSIKAMLRIVTHT